MDRRSDNLGTGSQKPPKSNSIISPLERGVEINANKTKLMKLNARFDNYSPQNR